VARPLLRQDNQGTGTRSASIVPSTLFFLFLLYEYLPQKIVGVQCAGVTLGEESITKWGLREKQMSGAPVKKRFYSNLHFW
jgi:hypothetical protein